MAEKINYFLFQFEVKNIDVYSSNSKRLWSINKKNILTEKSNIVYRDYRKDNNGPIKFSVIFAKSAFLDKLNCFNFPEGKLYKMIEKISSLPSYLPPLYKSDCNVSLNNINELIKVYKNNNIENNYDRKEYVEKNISSEDNIIFNVSIDYKDSNLDVDDFFLIKINTNCTMIGYGNEELDVLSDKLVDKTIIK